MAMDLDSIPNLLEKQRDAAPDDLQHFFLEFEDFWERKLWHELTDSLLQFYGEPQSKPQRLPLFDGFILMFADKINQLKLVDLGIYAASQCKDDEAKLAFLKTLKGKLDKTKAQDAYVYALVAVADKQLSLDQFDEAKKSLDESEALLDTFDYLETKIHAAFYQVNAAYNKVKNDFTAFYRNTLLHLACKDLDEISQRQCQITAYELSLAALASDTIFNFGELLLHPILESLSKTEKSWLRDLLFAFNAGDLAKYDSLAPNMSREPVLAERQDFLRLKISLSALTQTVFQRPPHDRAMTFSTISQETKVPMESIEHLIMKALSLGLVKGTIDQVAEVARINWVQPKVLDMKQIEGMRLRLKEWDSSVNQLGNWIEGVGRDVWAA
ncbi:hypothetical protein K402DRAFT_392417 [Aulographum hederae CBS 113979]|uniref:PCI domain-containing protein n=1 Tax=Aulographum hederae CBS 113979 TaxID=1176131 RepID=A0A6G1H3M6_9PEZI|nr:hypothetical protein K402DRAFT_392417 [Aulographum hederae CBS 113979]